MRGLLTSLLLLFATGAAAQSAHPMLGPVPAGATPSPVVATPAGIGSDIGYGTMFYFAQGQYRFDAVDTADPGNPQTLFNLTEGVQAGAWVPAAERGDPEGAFYYLTAVAAGVAYLYYRNITTGATTQVGVATPPSGTEWIAMTFYAGVLYALATNCAGLNYLYAIDVNTAAMTQLATFTAAVCLISMAAFVASSVPYILALDVELDQLFLIDLTALTIAALALTIGYDTGFNQAMAYSAALGLIILATIRDPAGPGDRGGPIGELRLADLGEGGVPTGSTTLIGALGSGSIEALSFDFLNPPAVTSEAAAPETFRLSEVHPNPFAPEAVVSLQLDRAERVRVTVLDRLGRPVATLHDGPLAAGGPHYFRLDASALADGLYFVRVAGESFAATRKATVAR